MTDNPSKPVNLFLLAFLALCLVATDAQCFGILDSAIAALRAVIHGAST
ncbi:hypothetical protein [Ancylobacter polymorphus]|uniref:Uncharacterized protein n=1 Tax=Ancylobacter polymorphus TaxID=223390 RepID=A0A9E7D5P1_9HYPH|nr:hypothetical protein [Ancylobacter polymorphus]UOK72982.1 hypothetical protein K9D25_09925 [Ancylobacter polymorphus]